MEQAASDIHLLGRNVQIGIEVEDWVAAIEKACVPLIKGSYINDKYIQDVIEREKRWPTALPTQPVAVAIPHGEHTENIYKSAISACLLKRPVCFRESGGEETNKLEVVLIFILAIKNNEGQTDVLRQLMGVISDQNILKALLKAETEQEFANIFNHK